MKDDVQGPIMSADDIPDPAPILIDDEAEVEDISDDISEIKKDTNAILDAVKELTTTIAQLKTDFELWRKAGKF